MSPVASSFWYSGTWGFSLAARLRISTLRCMVQEQIRVETEHVLPVPQVPQGSRQPGGVAGLAGVISGQGLVHRHSFLEVPGRLGLGADFAFDKPEAVPRLGCLGTHRPVRAAIAEELLVILAG